MIAALFYLQFHSFKNRLLSRFKRLRQPKYLFGAIVGGLYFYWFVFGNLMRARRGAPIPTSGLADQPLLVESIAALGLFLLVVVGWLWGKDRAALAFTEAEIAFLFPAPVSRRALINYKLLRSQLAVLFSALVFTMVIRRTSGGGNVVIRMIGWWVVLATLNLHFMGSSFVRTRLLDRGISNWKRRVGVLTIVALLVGGVVLWARQSFPPPPTLDLTNVEELISYVQQVLESGPVPYLLFPFEIVARPFLSTTWGSFLIALIPALLLMALHYWWVIRSNVAFEEASIEHSRKMADRIANMRANNWQPGAKAKKPKRAPFALKPVGPPMVALFWKNLISAGQGFSIRLWFMLIWVVVSGGFILSATVKSAGTGLGLGFFALMLLALSLVFGPQMLRNDLRQDLLVVDVLKMYPMRGRQLVLGQLLAPAAILTGVQWLLLLMAGILLSRISAKQEVSVLMRVGFGLGVALLCPLINMVLLVIPNAAVLLLPAWFHTKEAPQAIEATGQRLILVIGQMLILMAALLPPAAMATLVFWIINSFLGLSVAVLVAAVAAGAVLAVELYFAIRWLGGLFERFDLSAELAA
jgi:ABC-2 type transport system permease protein